MTKGPSVIVAFFPLPAKNFIQKNQLLAEQTILCGEIQEDVQMLKACVFTRNGFSL